VTEGLPLWKVFAQEAGDVNLSVKALIRDAAGRLLLLKDARSHWWDLPGGHVHGGETLEEAIEREVFEETGLRVLSMKEFGTSELKLGREERVVSFYEVQASGDVAVSHEHKGFEWVEPKDVANYDVGVFRAAIESFTGGERRVKAAMEALKEVIRIERLSRRTEAVLAIERKPEDAKERVRREAEAVMRESMHRALALAEADALARERNSKARDAELATAMLLVLLVGVEEAYGHTAPQLATIARDADHSDVATTEEEKAHADTREPLLKDFVEDSVQKTRAAAKQSRKDGDRPREVARKVKQAKEEIEQSRGKTVADTEAAAASAASQLRALKRAGYTHAFWVTVGDDRVRESHVACEAAGAVKIGSKFPNGLRYPHEPGAPAGETANCRCWLEGASKK